MTIDDSGIMPHIFRMLQPDQISLVRKWREEQLQKSEKTPLFTYSFTPTRSGVEISIVNNSNLEMLEFSNS